MNRGALALLFLLAPTCARAADPLDGLIIRRVTVTGNRTDRAVLEPRIALKEGRAFHESDVALTRRNLYEMRLFKTVKIDASEDAGLGGVDVHITAEDGWFVLPLPFIVGGGGGSGASLVLMERNYFARAESLFASTGFNRDGYSVRLGGAYLKTNANAGVFDRTFTQYVYSDGAVNAVSLGRPSRTPEDAARYGTVAGSYTKQVQGGSAGAQYEISRRLRAGLELETDRVAYSDATLAVPGDAGRQNWGTARLTYGPGGGGSTGMTDLFGSIFGLGMADLDERLRALPARRLQFGSELAASQGTRLLGSDFDFTRLSGGLTAQIESEQRHRLSARVVGVKGYDLPYTQAVATNRMLGLRGNYAREFRGDEGLGASLSFSYSLSRSHRGYSAFEVFTETARVTGAGPAGTQSGVGAHLFYSFWRFPIPLGLGYTYSLTDKNGQVSFAIGAAFGT